MDVIGLNMFYSGLEHAERIWCGLKGANVVWLYCYLISQGILLLLGFDVLVSMAYLDMGFTSFMSLIIIIRARPY